MTKEEAYDSLITPLMAEIISVCNEHKIPILASFTLDKESGLHCTTVLADEAWEPTPELLAAVKCIFPPKRSPLFIKTIDGDGNVTRIDAVV